MSKNYGSNLNQNKNKVMRFLSNIKNREFRTMSLIIKNTMRNLLTSLSILDVTGTFYLNSYHNNYTKKSTAK